MNEVTITRLAKQAALAGQLIPNYPDPDNDLVTFPPSPYYRFLYYAAKHLNSRLNVELGVDGGGGSLHMAMAGGQTVGVDIAYNEVNITYIIRNHRNYSFLQGDSLAMAPIIYDKFGKIDLLFIDTTHTYEQTLAEYKAYEPYLSGKAIVCLDDLFRPGMDRAWADLPGKKKRFDFLHPSGSPTDGGFGVIWK